MLNQQIHAYMLIPKGNSPVNRDCRIHRLHLSRWVRPPPNKKCPGYDTKQSDGEAPLTVEFGECGMTLHCHCSQIYTGSK